MLRDVAIKPFQWLMGEHLFKVQYGAMKRRRRECGKLNKSLTFRYICILKHHKRGTASSMG